MAEANTTSETQSEHKLKSMLRRPRGRRRGMVVINTGNGKGKTTAALGVLFRAWGRGLKVVMFQFIKQTTSNYGENRAAASSTLR